MKKIGYKKQVKILMGISFGIILYWLLAVFYPIELGLCSYIHSSGKWCKEVYGEFLWPSSTLTLSTLITLIPLYFTKEAVYKAWRKFAIIYLPLAILWVALSDPYGGGNYISILDSRESVTFFVSGLFLFVSFVLIIYKSLKLRGK